MATARAGIWLMALVWPVVGWAQSAHTPAAPSHDAAQPALAERTAPDPELALAEPDRAIEISAFAPERSARPAQRAGWPLAAARWDDHPQGQSWSMAVMSALRGPGAPLLDSVPRDIVHWCPGYVQADRAGRAAFWTGLVSTLAWHESTHRPTAVGGGGRWFGLVQIAPGTARYRNCAVRSGQALLNGAANLRCGIRIMAITVPRDGVVSEGMRGVAADWGPFHSARKRADMRDWVRAQSYCQSRMRPPPRPERLLAGVIAPGGMSHAPDHSLWPHPRPVD